MTTRAKDITGQRFSKLVVVGRFGSNERSDALWRCACDCGGESVVKTGNLRSGKTASCGCIGTGPEAKNLTGRIFGRLRVVQRAGTASDRTPLWECKCLCGKTTAVRTGNLTGGVTRSCGCLQVETVAAKTGAKNPNFNPELTLQDRVRGRFTPGNKNWSKEVKKRDGYICVVCNGSPSGELESHHLEGYSENPELRIDVANGVCVCKTCHLEFHKAYGFVGTTTDQFREFQESNYEFV